MITVGIICPSNLISEPLTKSKFISKFEGNTSLILHFNKENFPIVDVKLRKIIVNSSGEWLNSTTEGFPNGNEKES